MTEVAVRHFGKVTPTKTARPLRPCCYSCIKRKHTAEVAAARDKWCNCSCSDGAITKEPSKRLEHSRHAGEGVSQPSRRLEQSRKQTMAVVTLGL